MEIEEIVTKFMLNKNNMGLVTQVWGMMGDSIKIK
jgi:hypothetical protein